MKKSFFFATMLLSIATVAQQRTFVKSVGANYAAKQVTFNISWAAGSRGVSGASTYNAQVWVFVDYQELQNGAAIGSWKCANIVLSSLPANCTADGSNTKGFWYQGQTSAAQNANITVTLSGVPAQFNWCAFASDCPPNALLENGAYTLRGTPPFTVDGVQLDNARKTYPAGTYCISSITDATGNPGGFINNFDCSCPTIQPGTVGFASTKTWVVGAQTWSAPVTATYCRKTGFSGGSSGAYKSDCRSNTAITYGDLFSWCMVVKFAATLCPGGWRVPTKDEFVALDKALGGTGNNRTDGTALAKYMNASTWGGQYAGLCQYYGSTAYQGMYGYYWSQSKSTSSILGYYLSLTYYGAVYPQNTYYEDLGLSLRCVK